MPKRGSRVSNTQSKNRIPRLLTFERLCNRLCLAADVVPIPPAVVEAALEGFVHDSGLEQLAENGFYVPDDGAGATETSAGYEIGFDCDDYAIAMGNYLESVLPWDDAEVSYGSLVPSEGDSGHAVVIVELDDALYGVDPQTGTVLGPFESVDDLEAALTEMMVTEYSHAVAPGTEFELTLSESEYFAGAPFYNDPVLLEAFEDALSQALEQMDDAYASVFDEYFENYIPEYDPGSAFPIP